MDNQFDNMDLPDDDLIDFEDEADQAFLENTGDSNNQNESDSEYNEDNEDNPNKKKAIMIISGIVATVGIIAGGVYLLNGNQEIQPDTEEKFVSSGVSPNNKVDPDEFNMHTYEYEQAKVPVDLDTIEKEDTLIYWENEYDPSAFVGITEDGQLFVTHTEAEIAYDNDLEIF